MAKKKKIQQKKKRGATKAAQKSKSKAGWWKDKNTAIGVAIVLVLTFITFIPSLNNDFTNWDDPDYVTENPHIIKMNGRSLNTIFTEGIAANYHPLTMLSLAFNYQISELDAGSYHAVNLLLHLLCTFFVFLFIYHLNDRKPYGALFVAFLFGVHPMHVESVAWIAERKDVLYGMFFMAGLVTYVKYLKNKLNNKYLIYTLILFICSGLSKPTAVMFPIILLLVDFYHSRKWDTKAIVEKIPFFLFALFIGWKTYSIQAGVAVGATEQYSLLQRISFASYGTIAYLWKMIVPINMSTFYPYPDIKNLPIIFKVAPFLASALAAAVLWSTRKTKVFFFGFFFYLIINALTLQFLTVGRAIISDRYTYIPYVGIFFIFGYFLDKLIERKNEKPFDGYFNIAKVALPVIGVAFMVLSFMQTKVWKNSDTLWTNVKNIFPDDPTSYNNLGNYYYNTDKNAPKALEYLGKALSLDPRFYDAYISRGKIYRQTKKLDLAMADYSKAVAIKPNDASVYNNRGNVYFSMNRLDEAIKDYHKVLEIQPNDSRSLGNLGAVYARQKNFPEALKYLDKAIMLNPGYVDAYVNRGVIYSQMKKHQQAIDNYTTHLKYRNDNSQAYFWRAQDYQKLGKNQNAINDYNNAIKLAPNAGAYYKSRGQLHAMMGNAAQANQDQQKAAQLGAK